MIAGGKRYTSVLHCASTIVKEDGPMGLLKGWTAQYIRLGPQTMVMRMPSLSFKSCFQGLYLPM